MLRVTLTLLVLTPVLACWQPAFAQKQIVHDAEYYVLEAQHGEKWADQDREIQTKLKALREKHGTPPNIIHIMWDDTPVGEIGIPHLQKNRGFETPNMNEFAKQGMYFTRMYTEPSCTPSRGAVITGRHAVRNGMYNVGFPYEYGGLAAKTRSPWPRSSARRPVRDGLLRQVAPGRRRIQLPEPTRASTRLFGLPTTRCRACTFRGASARCCFRRACIRRCSRTIPTTSTKAGGRAATSGPSRVRRAARSASTGRRQTRRTTTGWSSEFQKRTLAFMKKNAAAKKPFYIAYWPQLASFMGIAPEDKPRTSAYGMLQEGLVRFDDFVGVLMDELKAAGIEENTLVILMADNGPMTHDGPPGMVETLYRGGKGDYLEGALRVPCLARWPGVIEPGQVVGDIIHETDLFTTFANLGGAKEHIPTDRIIDGVDQTALFLEGDAQGRRDYVFVYTGNILAATVKGRFKRRWVGDKPGLSGAAFFDLYNDPREVQGKMLPGFPAKGMFTIMKTRHLLWKQKFPDKGQNRDFPFRNIENARPETIEATKPRIPADKVPFDPREFIQNLPEWDNVDAEWGAGEH